MAVAAVAEIDMICNNTNRLLLQFHITGRCNMQCKHCYRTEGNVQPLTTEMVLDVIDQFAQLQEQYNSIHHLKKKGHINITGGEPFIREDIDRILDYLGSYKKHISFGVLSNGSFLDEDKIKILKKNSVAFVQLSIDGNRDIHDSLRAPGDYERTLRTAKMLEQHGIHTHISFTANQSNYVYLPRVASACRKHGITKLWTDRLVPIGAGEQLLDSVITKDFLSEYLKAIKKAQGTWVTKLLYPKTQVTANRALQFLGTGGQVYSCSAGISLITVDEFGNVMPCRRMPIICGNILEEPLKNIYFEHDVFVSLRKKDIPKSCSHCQYSYYCRGGAKCQAYAVFGNLHKADPSCPLIKG